MGLVTAPENYNFHGQTFLPKSCRHEEIWLFQKVYRAQNNQKAPWKFFPTAQFAPYGQFLDASKSFFLVRHWLGITTDAKACSKHMFRMYRTSFPRQKSIAIVQWISFTSLGKRYYGCPLAETREESERKLSMSSCLKELEQTVFHRTTCTESCTWTTK